VSREVSDFTGEYGFSLGIKLIGCSCPGGDHGSVFLEQVESRRITHGAGRLQFICNVFHAVSDCVRCASSLRVVDAILVFALLLSTQSWLAEIEERRQQLLAKYGDDQIVARIMGREVWEGQSHEQLRDALGVPVDTDEKVMKKHRREIWKYHQTGVNRFGLRVTLEDGIVVGWDQKM